MFKPRSNDQCCGCMACVNACPENIIEVTKDELGFGYPVLQYPDKCINCNMCNKACPSLNYEHTTNVGSVICSYNLNEDERNYSSSGGVFPLLCNYILNCNGVCYGVAFNDCFQTQHVRIDSVENIKQIYSSKYTESYRGYIFRNVKEDLKSGRKVLFSGTPCQVRGLCSYLGKNYENLFLIDLFCYGIPSPKIWSKWLDYVSKGRTPVFVDFRDKSLGWDNYSLRIEFDDGSCYCEPKAKDLFISTFSKGAYIRKSCYKCKNKAFPRVSDLTLGDFQELKAIFPEENAKNGWSMIRINSEKGQQLFQNIKNALFYREIEAKLMDGVHPGIGAAVPEHPNREKIINNIDKLDINTLLSRYATLTLKMKLRQKLSRLKHCIIK